MEVRDLIGKARQDVIIVVAGNSIDGYACFDQPFCARMENRKCFVESVALIDYVTSQRNGIHLPLYRQVNQCMPGCLGGQGAYVRLLRNVSWPSPEMHITRTKNLDTHCLLSS